MIIQIKLITVYLTFHILNLPFNTKFCTDSIRSFTDKKTLQTVKVTCIRNFIAHLRSLISSVSFMTEKGPLANFKIFSRTIIFYVAVQMGCFFSIAYAII